MAKQWKPGQMVTIDSKKYRVVKSPSGCTKCANLYTKSWKTPCVICLCRRPVNTILVELKPNQTNTVMARKQYKPGQFFWIRGRQYRIAKVERHVQDPCNFCALSDVCNPSMMNWCADLMPTHYYFKKC